MSYHPPNRSAYQRCHPYNSCNKNPSNSCYPLRDNPCNICNSYGHMYPYSCVPVYLGPTGPTGPSLVGPTGPTGTDGLSITGPIGPTGALINSYIYNQYISFNPGISIPDLTFVPIPVIRSLGSDVTYNESTSTFTINTLGTYLFMWHLLLAPSNPSNTDIIIALASNDGTIDFALSGNSTQTTSPSITSSKVLIAGSTIVTFSRVIGVGLLNRSGYEIQLLPVQGAVAPARFFEASITIVRFT